MLNNISQVSIRDVGPCFFAHFKSSLFSVIPEVVQVPMHLANQLIEVFGITKLDALGTKQSWNAVQTPQQQICPLLIP